MPRSRGEIHVFLNLIKHWLTAFVSVNKIYSLVMYLKQTKDISVDIILESIGVIV